MEQTKLYGKEALEGIPEVCECGAEYESGHDGFSNDSPAQRLYECSRVLCSDGSEKFARDGETHFRRLAERYKRERDEAIRRAEVAEEALRIERTLFCRADPASGRNDDCIAYDICFSFGGGRFCEQLAYAIAEDTLAEEANRG